MFFVYILINRTGKIYVGKTNNINIRLEKHNSGKNFYTKNKGPWKMIYHETLQTRGEAVRRERFLKTGKG